MKLAVITLLAIVLLSGCAAVGPAKFSPAGGDRKAFDRDNYECERDARSIRGNECTQMSMFETCMSSKGHQAILGTANKGLLCR